MRLTLLDAAKIEACNNVWKYCGNPIKFGSNGIHYQQKQIGEEAVCYTSPVPSISDSKFHLLANKVKLERKKRGMKVVVMKTDGVVTL